MWSGLRYGDVASRFLQDKQKAVYGGLRLDKANPTFMVIKSGSRGVVEFSVWDDMDPIGSVPLP
jgi:hypothetical protein